MNEDERLDAALEAWGQAPMATDLAIARIVTRAAAVPGPAPARRWWTFGAAGAVAASLALALLLARPAAMPDAAAGDNAALAGPMASFAVLYSMTEEEEYLL